MTKAEIRNKMQEVAMLLADAKKDNNERLIAFLEKEWDELENLFYS